MKLLVLFCALVGFSSALLETAERCESLLPRYGGTDQDCEPYKDELFALYDQIWAGNYTDIFDEWLSMAIPEEWREQEVLDYCIMRQCRGNEPLKEYIHLHAAAPFCIEWDPDDWMTFRFIILCDARANRREFTAEEYKTSFCMYNYHITAPNIPCPDNVAEQDFMLRAVGRVYADAGAQSPEEIDHHYWHQWLEQLAINSRSNDYNTFYKRTLRYGWIVSKNSSIGVMTPTWSRLHGAVIPIAEDIEHYNLAIEAGSGVVSLGDIRLFDCETDPFDKDVLVCPERTRDDNPEVNILGKTPEILLLVPTNDYIVAAMATSVPWSYTLKDAMLLTAEQMKNLGM